MPTRRLLQVCHSSCRNPIRQITDLISSPAGFCGTTSDFCGEGCQSGCKEIKYVGPEFLHSIEVASN